MYLTWCALQWCKTPKLHSWKNLHHRRSKSVVPIGNSGKNFSFNFKCYNLTIHAVKCRETFCTCSPSSLVQDPTVEIAKKWRKKSFGLLELEMVDLERFRRNTPLGPLGVKVVIYKGNFFSNWHFPNWRFSKKPLFLFCQKLGAKHQV
jgi:hypothetical protein